MVEGRTAQLDDSIYRASKQLQNLLGYCIVAKSGWEEEDEVWKVLSLISARLMDTLMELEPQEVSK
jgi:hypothetical protein